MKAIEQYFHVVLFIMLYKVVLTFRSVDETLVCDHSNESYRVVLSRMQYLSKVSPALFRLLDDKVVTSYRPQWKDQPYLKYMWCNVKINAQFNGQLNLYMGLKSLEKYC